MSIINDYSNRQLVPRLLSFETSNILSLNTNTTNNTLLKINRFELDNYYKLKNEWKNEKNKILAIEILMYKIIHESLTINTEQITFLKEQKNHLNLIEKEILDIATCKLTNNEKTLEPSYEDTDIRNMIKKIRMSTNINLKNPIQWCNLGYCYTKLGLKDKAKRAFLISIGLNNSNRHIVRTVARFFLHLGEVDFGHRILTMSPRIVSDPNIISAEIAFSELIGKKSKFIDNGIRLKDNKNLSIFEKNELLAQIATLEFSHGKNSKGKLLINECLLDPNENSLAQIAFLEKKHVIEPIIEAKTSVSFQYEALARHHFNNDNFIDAYKYARSWYNFQPFSSYPAALSSYIAIELLEKYHEAIEITETALKISPNNIILKNNLAFAYAKSNKIEEAVNIVNKINRNGISEHDQAVLNATTGFIAYKLGDIEKAKIGYIEAIKYFRLKKEDESLARALFNYSSILDKDESNIILKEVLELSKKNTINELIYLLRKKNIE